MVFPATDECFYSLHNLYDILYAQITMLLWRSTEAIKLERTFTIQSMFYSIGYNCIVLNKPENKSLIH